MAWVRADVECGSAVLYSYTFPEIPTVWVTVFTTCILKRSPLSRSLHPGAWPPASECIRDRAIRHVLPWALEQPMRVQGRARRHVRS